MVLKVNGTDITSYICEGGMRYRRDEVGSTVTTLDGVDHHTKDRDRVTVAYSFIPLTRDQLHSVLSLFTGNYVSVTYYDIYTDAERTMKATSDAREASFWVKEFDGDEIYNSLTITFKEL